MYSISDNVVTEVESKHETKHETMATDKIQSTASPSAREFPPDSSAKIQANIAASDAVIARLAPISVAQFLSDPKGPARLIEMKELDSWKRGEFVVAQGWATMPGEQEADSGLAREVATRLMEIEN